MTFTHALATNNYGEAKFIVTSNAANGTHTTIASAITAATSGDTIFIRTGTYTENLTLKAGVNLTAFGSDSSDNGTGNVIISGTCTLTTAGTVSISGIQLQTNGAALLAVTGSAASIVTVENCYLNMTNSTGITFSSSSASASINITNCFGNLGTTGIGIFTHSSAGTLLFFDCDFSNSGGSSTANTQSAGILSLRRIAFTNPTTTSGTALASSIFSQFTTSTQNVTCLTVGGSGNGTFLHCSFMSGTASCISVGSALNLFQCDVSSSNTNAITGAGTLNYSVVSFSGTSSTMNTTTQAGFISRPGISRSTHQPAFLAYLSATVTNVTGNGTVYTLGTTALTEVFDQNGDFNTNGTFTAPYTGRYQISLGVGLTGCTINTSVVTTMITSNRQYQTSVQRPASALDNYATLSMLADMDAADTYTATVVGIGEAAATDDVQGGANPVTTMNGFLVC